MSTTLLLRLKRMTLLAQYEMAGTMSGISPSSLLAATLAVHVEGKIGLLYEHSSLTSFT